jgi:hypothetical protein
VNRQTPHEQSGTRERDARAIARIWKLRFSPLSLIGGRGNRLVDRAIADVSAGEGIDADVAGFMMW